MICAPSFAFSLRRLAGLDHTSLRPQKRGCLLLGTGAGEGRTEGGGGKRAREWRLDRGYRPKKTGETVDRRQSKESVKAVSSRHFPATSALRNCWLGRVTRTMSVALLLRNNPKRKKSNFRSPPPSPCS